MIAVAATDIERLAALERQARRVVGNAEGECVRLHVVAAFHNGRREDQDLVADRQGGQHPGAAHDDAVWRFANDAKSDVGIGELVGLLAPIDLRIGQRVRQGEVVLAHVLEVVPGVVGELRPALTEVLRSRSGSHQIDVEVVGHAAHEPQACVGPHLVHRRTAFEIVAGARHDEAHADRITGCRRRERHRVDQIRTVLEVVQRSQRMCRVGRPRMRRGIFDELAVDPQGGGLLAQSFQNLLSGSCSHLHTPIGCSIIEHMVRISNDTLAPSQTLDRGLLCLELIAGADRPLSVDTTAATLGLHRSIVYRLLRTLERRHLVERNDEGDYVPGPYLAVLSCGVRRNLRSAATPALADLCAELQMTAFLVVADVEEAVTIDSVEPTSLDAHVAYRPGTRHPIDRGAPGIALLAGRPARSGERREVIVARARGWAESEAEVIAGMASIAAPIADQGAIAVLWLAGNTVDVEEVAAHVVAAATEVTRRLTP